MAILGQIIFSYIKERAHARINFNIQQWIIYIVDNKIVAINLMHTKNFISNLFCGLKIFL